MGQYLEGSTCISMVGFHLNAPVLAMIHGDIKFLLVLMHFIQVLRLIGLMLGISGIFFSLLKTNLGLNYH